MAEGKVFISVPITGLGAAVDWGCPAAAYAAYLNGEAAALMMREPESYEARIRGTPSAAARDLRPCALHWRLLTAVRSLSSV